MSESRNRLVCPLCPPCCSPECLRCPLVSHATTCPSRHWPIPCPTYGTLKTRHILCPQTHRTPPPSLKSTVNRGLQWLGPYLFTELLCQPGLHHNFDVERVFQASSKDHDEYAGRSKSNGRRTWHQNAPQTVMVGRHNICPRLTTSAKRWPFHS